MRFVLNALILALAAHHAFAEVQESLFLETPFKPEQQLLYFETKANEASTRSMDVVDIPHFEIPLKLLEVNFAARFSREIQEQLLFTRNGQVFIRWLLNPEDTHWYQEIQEHFLKENNLKLEKKYFFKGQQTASRTYHIQDSSGKFFFAFKASTNKTGGRWTEKRQNISEAEDARFVADYLDYLQRQAPFEKVASLDEPAALKIKQLNMALLIRDLKPVSEKTSQNIYLPAFSALHSEVGIQIARKNGYQDPNEFWREHFVKASAEAVAEFAARTGLLPSNPHAQNFLIELDSKLAPTGKIILRDLADFFVYQDMVSQLHPAGEDFKKYFQQKFAIVPRISTGLLPFSGTPVPGWLKASTMDAWQKTYFERFEQKFLEVSGLQPQSFRAIDRHFDSSIFMGNYEVLHNTKSAQNFWNNLKVYKHPRGIQRCEKIF